MKDLTVKENKDLAVDTATGLVLHGAANDGVENLDRDVVQLPRLKLLQATSPEVQGEEFRDLNLRAGDIIDTVSMEKISGNVIPIKVLKGTNVLFVPRNAEGKNALKARKGEITDQELTQQGAILCSAVDGVVGDRFGLCSKCGLCNFVGQEKPICSRAINVLVMLESGLPAIISFRDTSYTYGKTFLTQLNNKVMTGTPIQALKFKASPVKKTAGDKQWYVLSMVGCGTATQEEYDKAYRMFVEYNKMEDRVMVAEEQPVIETQATSPADVTDII